MGMKLDGIYHGMELPGKFKMSVSECNLNCAESWVRDVGLFGKLKGWTLVIGGNVGASPRIGQKLLTELSDDQALETIEKVLGFYRENGEKKGERLGKMIDRIDFETVKHAVS